MSAPLPGPVFCSRRKSGEDQSLKRTDAENPATTPLPSMKRTEVPSVETPEMPEAMHPQNDIVSNCKNAFREVRFVICKPPGFSGGWNLRRNLRAEKMAAMMIIANHPRPRAR